jgi:predicted porin
MKKSLLAVAALTAFAGAAQAQSSVTVYGIVDIGVMGATNSPNLNSTTWGAPGVPYVSNTVKTNQTSGQAFGMMYGGESGSRLGFKGSEELGGGTKAIFTLEMGIGPNGTVANTGLPGVSQGAGNIQAGDTSLQGQIFGRGAYVGLSNDKVGTIMAGRQQNLMLDNIPNYDPVNAQLFSPISFSGTYGGGGYTDDSRVNGLKYVYKNSGFNGNAIYAPGGVTGQSAVGTTTGLQFGYEAAKWGVQAIASHTTDGQSLAGISATGAPTATGTGGVLSPTQLAGTAVIVPSNAVAVTVGTTTAYMLTSKYNVTDKFTLKAGYERENIGTPSNFSSVASMPVTASGYTVSSVTAYGANKSLNVFWVGANYQFTPAIKGSIGYYNATTLGFNGSGVAAATAATQAIAAGGTKSQYYSLLAEYMMSKRTNLYTGVMFNNNSAGNGYAPVTSTGAAPAAGPNLITTSVTYGLGMRHTF